MALLWPSFSWATDILVFGGDYSAPKMYLQNGQTKGILVDILNDINSHLSSNDRFVLRLMPWSRAYQSAVDGQGGIIGISKTQAREALFDFSNPVYNDAVVIVVPAGKTFNFKQLADLKGKNIGIGRGGSYGDDFDKAYKAGLFQLQEDNGPESRLRKLLVGRIDCALFNGGNQGFQQMLKDDPEMFEARNQFTVLPVPLKIDPNYLAFPKSQHRQALLDQVNLILHTRYAVSIVSQPAGKSTR